MTEFLERELVERTGLSAKQVREFRCGHLKKGAGVRMEKHRWVWSQEAAVALLSAFKLSLPPDCVAAEKSAPTPKSVAPVTLLERPDESRVLVVFRSGKNGIRNRSVVEALPLNVDGWKNVEERVVVRVGNNERYPAGRKIRVEICPNSTWLHRLAKDQTCL